MTTSCLKTLLAAAASVALGLCALPATAADAHAAPADAHAAKADAHGAKADSHAAPPPSIKNNFVRIDPSKVERPVPPADAPAAAGHAAPARPVPDAAATGTIASTEELRRRLMDKVNAVRASQAQAAAHKPVRVAAATKPAKGHGAGPAGAAGHAAHWGYQGDNGPESWGAMRPEFSLCSSGTRQSPIDIRDGVRVDLEPIRFDYHPTGFSVVDNGHTVQVNVAGGNTIQVNGRSFELVQFHFHRPSEERVNGRHFPMVAHLVHKDLEGRLAVIAVLMDQGKSHPMVQLVWNSLPLQQNDPLASPVPLDMNLLLPEDRRYYTYMGSLTTPPCSEGVLWLVLKQPAAMSPEQIAVFSRLYPMNARPIQAATNRLIKESF